MEMVIKTARTRTSGIRRFPRIPALLEPAIGLGGVIPLRAQEQEPGHEVPKAEVIAADSCLRASDTNFNGWTALLVGNLNRWLGIAADFDGHSAGEENEYSITFSREFAVRKNQRWAPLPRA
jgi:hypothetical protein